MIELELSSVDPRILLITHKLNRFFIFLLQLEEVVGRVGLVAEALWRDFRPQDAFQGCSSGQAHLRIHRPPH